MEINVNLPMKHNYTVQVKVKRLHEDAVMPQYQTPGAAAFDLHAIEDVFLMPGETKLVKTGLAFEIPEGYEMQIRPRSGMSFKTKVRVANSPGTIDSDYRGEVCIIVDNTDHEDAIFVNLYKIKKGERIAQAVIAPVTRAVLTEVTELSDTERGSGGFGSTGK